MSENTASTEAAANTPKRRKRDDGGIKTSRTVSSVYTTTDGSNFAQIEMAKLHQAKLDIRAFFEEGDELPDCTDPATAEKAHELLGKLLKLAKNVVPAVQVA